MSTQPLIFLPPGAKGTVYDIQGDLVTKRLFEMGFNKGQELQVIKNDVGPLIIGINGGRIAVGRGMAHKIMLNMD